MARTIEQIKNDIGNAFVRNETLQVIYEDLDPEKSFEEQFSRASIESIIIYIVAYAGYVLEKLFDTHRTEVEEYIRQMKPHTLRWYVNKVKMFRFGYPLIDGTDTYDDAGLTEKEITDSQVVKFAAATEGEATIYIKVAGGTNADKRPLTGEEKDSLQAYIREVKDAGVRVEVISEPATRLKLDLHIYYNAMVLNNKGESLQDGGEPVKEAIKDYIQNLPFNGEYRNAELIDRLQVITGIVIPTLNSAEESNDGGKTWQVIPINATPYAGYYTIDDEADDSETGDLQITYEAYESISN